MSTPGMSPAPRPEPWYGTVPTPNYELFETVVLVKERRD
jgi:hypothetical protein